MYLLAIRWKQCADFSPDLVHEDDGLLLWGPSFDRLTNGIRSTALPVPMNFSPWISERAPYDGLQWRGVGL